MVLAICLIVMLILAILGSSAIKTTIVQERATGLTRNKQISFDSSEAALRFGEINADTISIGAATDGSVGLWLPDPTSPRWLNEAIKSSFYKLRPYMQKHRGICKRLPKNYLNQKLLNKF